MAWIYLAESADSQKPSKDTSGLSPTVKTTDTLRPCSCHECPIDRFPLHQYGTTCGRCGETCFHLSKSSTEDFLAKTLVLLVAEKAWAESAAGFSSRSLGLLARYDRASSSWKMSQLSVLEEQILSSRHWPVSGMTVDGNLYPLPTSEPTISEHDGGYWRTPDTGAGGTSGLLKAGKTHRKSGAAITMRLVDQVNNPRFWPTPTVFGNSNQPKPGTKRGTGLSSAAKFWPTPTAEPFRSRSGKRKGEMGLDRMAKMWPTPKASGGGPDYAAEARGKSANLATAVAKSVHMKKGYKPQDAVVGGSLNPEWVEWLMGYPSGWTVLKPWAIAWFQLKRLKRSKD